MDYYALHAAAKSSLERSGRPTHRITLWYLLIAYGTEAVVELVTLLWGEALDDVLGIAALNARNHYFLWTTILTVLFAVFANLWTVGYENYTLRLSRGQHARFGDLAEGLRAFGPFVLLYLIKTILIALWSMLFVIPGILAAYRYRLAEKVLLDHPDYSPLQALRESRRLTYGHRLELFVLDLTFWLHYLIIFALEYWMTIAQRLGLAIHGIPMHLACFSGTTAILLIVEMHKLPLVQTTYAHAYDWICACNRERTMV
ncbi:MAG: DUF975 family protein [Oscillospiraceae bacterium]|nr:DUF975 family protein [Oscillospiraceae bacterium]